ncbi:MULTISPECIES: FeoA family protein [Stenotrophomonas]|uniref:FeoA family protein n=1 Tax=Stenotrophomonas bentonitica TaxID=1450134 RepID=A0ABU9JL79_9GAMM|nr:MULTISPECIES: FeoA family protein [Stenotrophomonas]AOX63969.1 ferrous iron transport protein A [Stenotrophomonas sp. LM091]MCX2920789.1 FeoA family protein [Stenotrophomonas rhizophila]MDX5517140.1 ferrous iron transport protein A [Stenotrophomonas sp. RG-453]OFS92558.1 iron transporter [Stenotrophomonas sp. HMSC10F06]WIA63163.1 FeoA family protein [Stenotrophomonas sp. BIO128-Bstrain]
MTLSDLALYSSALVESVQELHANDAIARRLKELGFVKGEEVRLVARGPVGAEPLLVQVGFTRFALRRSEAARIVVTALQGQEARA